MCVCLYVLLLVYQFHVLRTGQTLIYNFTRWSTFFWLILPSQKSILYTSSFGFLLQIHSLYMNGTIALLSCVIKDFTNLHAIMYLYHIDYSAKNIPTPPNKLYTKMYFMKWMKWKALFFYTTAYLEHYNLKTQNLLWFRFHQYHNKLLT